MRTIPWPRRVLPRRWAALLGGLLLAVVSLSQALPARADTNFDPSATGFVAQAVIGSGVLTAPTSIAFTPDGRMLIAEKSGTVRVWKNNAVLSTPFINLNAPTLASQTRVENSYDMGLLGIAVDPNFATNGYVYLSFTYKWNPSCVPHHPDLQDPSLTICRMTSRVIRVTANGDTAAPAGSNNPKILLGTVSPDATHAECDSYSGTGTINAVDCMPADFFSHTVGALRFASDGTLFIGNGEGSNYDMVTQQALRAQKIDSLAGKLLRIRVDAGHEGEGVADNPFYVAGSPQANRSKVWNYGLRNPYNFGLRPGDNRPFIGQVGWNDWEAVDEGTKGSNFGWPCYEGPDPQPGYQQPSSSGGFGDVLWPNGCQGIPAVKSPLHYYNHNGQLYVAVVGGSFYSGLNYPAAYRNQYFFGDVGEQFIHFLRFNGGVCTPIVSGNCQFQPFALTNGMFEEGPVDIASGPNGDLYYVGIFTNKVWQICYKYQPSQTTCANRLPTAQASATPGAPPSAKVQFASAGSADPDHDPLIAYNWSFGDNSTGTGASPQHTYPNTDDAKTYTVTLTVTDWYGGVSPPKSLNVQVNTAVAPNSQAAPPASAANYPLAIPYTAADNAGGSGLKQVKLWVRPPGGAWRDSGLPAQTAAAGSFSYTPQVRGTYAFATQATDNKGNVEAAPTGDGDGLTTYTGLLPGAYLTLSLKP